MGKRTLSIMGIFAILSMILFTSCGESPFEPDDEPTMQKETRSGTLTIVEGSTLQEKDLEVVTFAASDDLDSNGEFSVEANETEKYQLLFFRSITSRNPVYLGLYNPLTNTVAANDTSTALALMLFNPYLIYTNQTQREEYLQAVKQNSKFSELLSLLRNAYQTDANTALDYEVNPTIYETAVHLMKETMENLGGGGGLRKTARFIGDPPYVEDASGNDIKFVNPRHIWYGAGVYPNAGTMRDVVSVNRKVTVLSFNWGWPPVVVTEPEETIYAMGNGYFKLYLHKGGEFSKITQWNDPSGRATILNTGQSILYIAELIIGYLPLPPLAELPNHIVISPERAHELSDDIAQKNPEGFLIHFTSLIADNSESITYWIWQDTQEDAAHEFLSAVVGIVENVTLVLKLLGFVNEEGPFVWDLVFAQRDVTYFVTQENGTITSMEENHPPEADFSISPPAGTIETEFTFDASSTTDDQDDITDLDFRWDWESDGIWDVDWSENYLVTHSYPKEGTFTVALEVRDSGGLIGSATHAVNVADVDEGLVAYWSFDEGSGNIAHDYSGNDNDGTIHGAIWTSGISGNALRFGGREENDRVEVLDDASLHISDEITLAAWIYRTANNDYWDGTVGKWHWKNPDAEKRSYLLHLNEGDNKVKFSLSSDGTEIPGQIDAYSTTDIQKDQWYFVVGTYDGSSMKVYVNGVFEGSTPCSLRLFISNEILEIGRISKDSTQCFGGIIDEVRIYNKALNDDEIQELYNYPKK